MGSGEPENQLQVLAGQAARMVKQQAFRLGYFNVSDQMAMAHGALSEELHG